MRRGELVAFFAGDQGEALREAKQHLYTTLYSSEELQRDLQEAAMVVRNLFACWVNDPSLLPSAYQSQLSTQGVARLVADYIAGMTDQYILLQHAEWVKQQGK